MEQTTKRRRGGPSWPREIGARGPRAGGQRAHRVGRAKVPIDLTDLGVGPGLRKDPQPKRATDGYCQGWRAHGSQVA